MSNLINFRMFKFVKLFFIDHNCFADYDGDASDAYLRGYLTTGLDNNEVLFTDNGGSPDDVHYYFKDGLGSIRQIIDDAATPAVEAYLDYYAFGADYTAETYNISSNRYKWENQQFYSESSNYFLNHNQIYDPSNAIFLINEDVVLQVKKYVSQFTGYADPQMNPGNVPKYTPPPGYKFKPNIPKGGGPIPGYLNRPDRTNYPEEPSESPKTDTNIKSAPPKTKVKKGAVIFTDKTPKNENGFGALYMGYWEDIAYWGLGYDDLGNAKNPTSVTNMLKFQINSNIKYEEIRLDCHGCGQVCDSAHPNCSVGYPCLSFKNGIKVGLTCNRDLDPNNQKYYNDSFPPSLLEALRNTTTPNGIIRFCICDGGEDPQLVWKLAQKINREVCACDGLTTGGCICLGTVVCKKPSDPDPGKLNCDEFCD